MDASTIGAFLLSFGGRGGARRLFWCALAAALLCALADRALRRAKAPSGRLLKRAIAGRGGEAAFATELVVGLAIGLALGILVFGGQAVAHGIEGFISFIAPADLDY